MTKKFIILFVAAAVLLIGGDLEKQAVASEGSGQEFFDVVQAADGQEEFIESIAGGWAYVASMPAKRRFLAAATGLDGTIYAIGGMYGSDVNHADVYAYDPVADSWTSVAPMNYARNSLAAATGQDGKIYAIGGFYGGHRNWVEVYNPETNAWSIITSMPTGRYMLGAAAVDGKIYAIGGRSFWLYVEARVEMYDPNANSWSVMQPMPTPRYGLGVAVADGKIYAIGGRSDFGPVNNAVEMYDPTTNEWSTKTPMPGTERYRAGVVTGPDGNIYVIGGMLPGGTIVSGVMKYDPRTDTWSGAPGLPCQRVDLAAAVGQNATIYAIGGYAYCNGGYTNTVLAYSPVRIVSIDIKPGSYPNSINLGSQGNVTVAIFSTSDFDATSVDPTTVTLEGASVKLKGKGTAMSSFEDVDGDGLLDIVVHVDTSSLLLSSGDTEAILEGETFDGVRIRGTDSVRIVNE